MARRCAAGPPSARARTPRTRGRSARSPRGSPRRAPRPPRTDPTPRSTSQPAATRTRPAPRRRRPLRRRPPRRPRWPTPRAGRPVPRRRCRRRSRSDSPPVALLLLRQHLLVERQPLVVQLVPHALGLGAHVDLVVRIGRLLDRDLVGDPQPVALQAADLLGIVGEDPDRAQAEVDEDLRTDAV